MFSKRKWLNERKFLFCLFLFTLAFLWKIEPFRSSLPISAGFVSFLRLLLFYLFISQISFSKIESPLTGIGEIPLEALRWSFLTLPFWVVYLFWIKDFHPSAIVLLPIYELIWEFLRFLLIFTVPPFLELLPWMLTDYLKNVVGPYSFPWGTYPLMLTTVHQKSSGGLEVFFLFPLGIARKAFLGIGSPYLAAAVVISAGWVVLLFLGYLLGRIPLRGSKKTSLSIFVIAVFAWVSLSWGICHSHGHENGRWDWSSNKFKRILLVQPLIPSKACESERTKIFWEMLEKVGRIDLKDSLVVLPENVFRFPFNLSRNFCLVKEWASTHDVYVLLGANRVGYDNSYKNSAFLFTPAGEVFVYDKVHLVPFGEYLPFPFDKVFLFRKLVEAAGGGGFSPGGTIKPVYDSLGVLICFESAFPELSYSLVKKGVRVIINITNDYWSKSSFSHAEHFKFAFFRAVQFEVPLIRCGNSGISAVISPEGEILFSLPPLQRSYGVFPP